MQDTLQEALKQNLRDIHLPDEVGLWPLAPAWWIIAFIVVAAILCATVFYMRHRTRNRYRRAAKNQLDASFKQWQENQIASNYLENANAILRRCVLHAQGSESLVGKTGHQWAYTLNRMASSELSSGAIKALGELCYQPQPELNTDLNIPALHQEISTWIKQHKSIVSSEQHEINIKEANHA